MLYRTRMLFLRLITLWTLGTGVGCIADDLRRPPLCPGLCTPFVGASAFLAVSALLAAARGWELKLRDLTYATAGSALGTGLVTAFVNPLQVWSLSLVTGGGALLGATAEYVVSRFLLKLGQSAFALRAGNVFSFLLLAMASGLGGGFVLMYLEAHNYLDLACSAGAEGAALGVPIVVIAGVLLCGFFFPRPLNLTHLMATGSCSLIAGGTVAYFLSGGQIVVSLGVPSLLRFVRCRSPQRSRP